MVPNPVLDAAVMDRVAATLAAEPGLMAALAAEPVKVARERFGLDLPADMTVRFGRDQVVFGTPGAETVLMLPPELQSDELPDELLEMASGGIGCADVFAPKDAQDE